jgi:hypothetical protein
LLIFFSKFKTFFEKTYFNNCSTFLKNLILLILTVVFFGLPKKWTVIFRKKLICLFFSNFKKSYLFNFDRRFFRASEKMDGHFSKKIFCLFFSIFKISYLFNFDRRFFGASEKKEGHFSKKIILIIVF